jgi:hypothetical protein
MLIRAVAISLCLVSHSVLAQTPATVSVRVELALPRFRDNFSDPKAVEAKAAALFAKYLTAKVGFLRFAVNDSSPYRLSFRLDRQDPQATSSFTDIGFWARLEHAGDEPKEKYWLPFRAADEFLTRVGSEADFLAEVSSKLTHQDSEVLRKEILRWVPITEIGLPNLNPLGVVLPFPLKALCMKNQSVVLFVAEIKGQQQTMEEQFKAQIVGKFTLTGSPTPDLERFRDGGMGKVIELTENDLADWIAQKKVTVKQIFVISYEHDASTCDNRQPDPVGTGTQ